MLMSIDGEIRLADRYLGSRRACYWIKMDGPAHIDLYLNFELREPGQWWKDGSVGELLAQSLHASDLWFDFRFYGAGAKEWTSIAASSELDALSRVWESKSYALQCDTEEYSDAPTVKLTIREDVFQLTVALGDAALDQRRADLLSSFAGFSEAMFRGLRSRALLALGSAQIDERYPRPRPPHLPKLCFIPGSLLDLYDLEYLASVDAAAEASALVAASLPPGASRNVRDGLISIQWPIDLIDLDTVNAARARQEQWLSSSGDLPLEEDYNELGDRHERSSNLTPHAPLTFYDETEQIGYWAVVPDSGGVLDTETSRTIEAIAKRGALEDGTVIAQLKLIAPIRKLSLALRRTALPLGVSAVLYPDRTGEWWDPEPPGDWFLG